MKADVNTNEHRIDVHAFSTTRHDVPFPNSIPLGKCIVNIEVEQFEIDRREQERLAKIRDLQDRD